MRRNADIVMIYYDDHMHCMFFWLSGDLVVASAKNRSGAYLQRSGPSGMPRGWTRAHAVKLQRLKGARFAPQCASRMERIQAQVEYVEIGD